MNSSHALLLSLNLQLSYRISSVIFGLIGAFSSIYAPHSAYAQDEATLNQVASQALSRRTWNLINTQFTDGDMTWGGGAHMAFINPATIYNGSPWEITYDWMSRHQSTPSTQNTSLFNQLSERWTYAYQLGGSFHVFGPYHSAVAWKKERTAERGRWVWAHQLNLKKLRLGMSFAWGRSVRESRGELLQIDSAQTSSQMEMSTQKGASTVSDQAENLWGMGMGLMYGITHWLSVSGTLSHLNDFDLSKGDLSLGVALKPLPRWMLGTSVTPTQGGASWGVSTQWRLWRGLGMEARYQRKGDHALYMSLAWRGNIGWSIGAGKMMKQTTGQTPYTERSSHLSLRIKRQVPRTHQLSLFKRVVVFNLQSHLETKSVSHLISSPTTYAPFISTLLALDRLSTDESVEAVVLIYSAAPLGWAQVEELRSVINRLQKFGKRVYSFLPRGDLSHYAVASTTHQIWVTPTSELMITGLLREQLYFKELLDRIKVHPEFITVGDYKSAPEIFTKERPSKESASATQAILDERYKAIIKHLRSRTYQQKMMKKREASPPIKPVAESSAESTAESTADSTASTSDQSPPLTQVERWMRGGPYSAQQALKLGLVDKVIHAVDLESELMQHHPNARLEGRTSDITESQWASTSSIAILYGVGEMGGGLIPILGEEKFTARSLIPLIRKVTYDAQVKGVLLRINSPGGAVSDAEEIWRALSQLAQRKPLVVSMGDTAASGGYYIAATAHRIFASPSTLTGSIGVFAGKVNLSEILGEWGVKINRERRGEGGGIFSPLTPWSQAQRDRLQKSMNDIYELFLSRVLKGRAHLTKEKLLPLAGGRIWTGRQALKNGLIDELGGMLDALRWLRRQTGLIDQPHRVRSIFPTQLSLFDRMKRQVHSDRSLLSPWLSQLPPSLLNAFQLLIFYPGRALAYAFLP